MGVGQLHDRLIWYRLAATYGSGPVWPWPCLRTAVFAEIFLIMWPNRWCGNIVLPWAILGHFFFSYKSKFVVDYAGRQVSVTKKQANKNLASIYGRSFLIHGCLGSECVDDASNFVISDDIENICLDIWISQINHSIAYVITISGL